MKIRKPRKSRVVITDYRAYLQSEHWQKCRERWFKKNPSRVCAACTKPYDFNFNLHHTHYRSLGTMRMRDLILLCQPCHEAVHKLHKLDGRHTPKQATDLIIYQAHERKAQQFL